MGMVSPAMSGDTASHFAWRLLKETAIGGFAVFPFPHSGRTLKEVS